MPLRYLGAAYDRTLALMAGTVRPEGVDLEYTVGMPNEIFRTMFSTDDYDASELSSSNFIIERARGDRRFVALPVFPSRVFRHNGIYVNTGAGIGGRRTCAVGASACRSTCRRRTSGSAASCRTTTAWAPSRSTGCAARRRS